MGHARQAGTRGPAREVGWRVRAGSLARWAGFGHGPEARQRPVKEEKHFSNKIFKEFKCHLSNIILGKKMTSFENVPKMKVA